jgi:hypothetical protein
MPEVESLCSQGLSLIWGEFAQGRIETIVIAFPHPICGGHLNFIDIAPQV